MFKGLFHASAHLTGQCKAFNVAVYSAVILEATRNWHRRGVEA